MCDKYTEQVLIHSDPTTNKTMEKNKLHRIIKCSKVTKGRLVHYYSRSEADIKKDINPDFAFSSWCGWHNDHVIASKNRNNLEKTSQRKKSVM